MCLLDKIIKKMILSLKIRLIMLHFQIKKSVFWSTVLCLQDNISDRVAG